MAFRIFRAVAGLALVSTLAGTAAAQTNRLHLGPRVSYHFDLERLGVGAQFSAPIARYLEFYPSVDYFFVEHGSFWSLNADLKYRIPAARVRWFYIGAGLNLAKNGDTRAGLNLLAGAESLKGRIHPFAEFRFTAHDGGSTGQLAAGLNFTLARH